ncbi:type IV toxin-antitoxin system AbiEi family antitoxin domain-containing protein [Planctomonas sp. JC2975]|uniref:DUF559 domain-containing protein n=1 Tax=Planctomonas sp. JC2975 TaxID=2729626 RepID=UPI00147396BE|nr:DUF559 domain-containing protein [Planctomonas sp. JC2975]NNC11924.1 type IV toxin-antitoxin system AbiEi family antitoxin domain-containing protein [Planctomonas sp. JC2975]
MPLNEPLLGIHSTTDLRNAGLTKSKIASAVAAGELAHLRRGWYAERSAGEDARAAVRIGGVLTASSASRHHGLWTPDDDRLHVLVAHNAARLRLPEPSGTPAVCLHWAPGALQVTAVAGPLQLLRDSLHCQGLETTVVVADSALDRRLVTLASLRSTLPSVARWCDSTSQSGTESLCRLRLRRRRIPVRTQVRIEGVGFVDLLVGERLVIECDSRTFHDGYQSARDYDRDLALCRQGYLLIRLQYRHVIFEWDKVEALILGIVRARRHMWRSGSAGSVIAL